jgi:hypothetical protein
MDEIVLYKPVSSLSFYYRRKIMKYRVFMLVALLISLMGLAVGGASATGGKITDFIFSVNLNNAVCENVIFQINFDNNPIVDDWNGYDLFGYTIVDANGVAVGAEWNGWAVGNGSYNFARTFGNINVINPITARPLTITFYDTTLNLGSGIHTQIMFDGIVNENAPIIAKYIIDPADYSTACAGLPLILPPAPPSDSRINPDNNAPVVVYVVAGGLQFYSPQGAILFDVTAEQIEAVDCPTSGEALIKQNGAVKLYRTSDCGFKVTAPALDVSKTYYLTFSALTGGTYRSFEQ